MFKINVKSVIDEVSCWHLEVPVVVAEVFDDPFTPYSPSLSVSQQHARWRRIRVTSDVDGFCRSFADLVGDNTSF